MTTKVSIDGYGTFFIASEKVGDLIKWLQANWKSPSTLGEVNNNTSNQATIPPQLINE
jgi:hypothetical protein